MVQMSLFFDDVEQKFHEAIMKDLKRGSSFANSKERIRAIFKNKNLTKDQRIELLKKEYGTGGYGPGDGFSQEHDSTGITIILETGEERHYSWEKIYDLIFTLISQGEY